MTNGAVILDFLLQYEESDWDFLAQLASHFGTFLVPDMAGANADQARETCVTLDTEGGGHITAAG